MHSLINGGGKVDSVILDVDGTIWNTTAIVAEAWNEAKTQLHLNVRKVDALTLQKEFGKTMSDIADDLWPSLSAKEKTNLMAECCKREQSALAMLNTNGHKTSSDICYKGVVDTLRRLCTVVPFFIVSNCQKGYIELVMEKTGLNDCITDYECYGNTGEGKAQNIKLLVSRNRLMRPIYVGDTQGDLDACDKAGVEFVWASYGFGRAVKAEYKIDSFEEIENAIHL